MSAGVSAGLGRGERTGMKQRAAVRVELAALPEGGVQAVFRGHGAAGLAEIAVRLDGELHQVLQLLPGLRGTRMASIVLPPHRLFQTLDLVTLPDCESLLPLPWNMDELYRLRPETPGLDGLDITGAFTAAPWLADLIGVEVLDGAALAGQGIAVRAPGSATWQYRVPLSALLAPGREAQLFVRAGGMIPDLPPVRIAANGLGVVGCLDVATPNRVEGWAVRLERAPKAGQARPLALDVLIGNDIVATIVPSERRRDIQVGDQQAGGTLCGFGFDLPSPADPRAAKRIGVRIAGTRTGLTGSPKVVDPMPGLMGRFDTLHGMSAHGWALDRAHPARKMVVEVIGPGGEILASGPASHFRGDLLGAGLADGLCAFKVDISAHYERLIGQEIAVRFAGTNVLVAGSPIRITPNGNQQRFLRRRDVLLSKPGVLPRLRRALTHRAGTDGISIIMPVHNTPRAWLSEALESVRHQFCDAWELICVDDGSTEPHVRPLIESYAGRDPRVRLLRSAQNVGVTRATNFGLRAAKYPYVTFLDHDDYLEPGCGLAIDPGSQGDRRGPDLWR